MFYLDVPPKVRRLQAGIELVRRRTSGDNREALPKVASNQHGDPTEKGFVVAQIPHQPINGLVAVVHMVRNRLNRESGKEREVEFRLLSLSRSFSSNRSEPYATLPRSPSCGALNTHQQRSASHHVGALPRCYSLTYCRLEILGRSG